MFGTHSEPMLLISDPEDRPMKGLLSIVLLLAFSTSLRAELKLDNVRFTYGDLGPARADAKVLPGETLTLAFTIAGLTKDAGGNMNIVLAGELLDGEGKSVAKMPAKTIKSLVALGGADVPGVLTFSLPNNFAAGKYVVRGVVKDALAGSEATTEQAVEVLPARLGIVQFRLTNDAQGQTPSGGNMTVGQAVHVHCRAVGFARKEKRIHLIGSLRILDAAGNATYPNPLSFSLDQEAPEDVTFATFRFAASANRTGRFTIQIEAQDKIAGRTVTQEVPIVVHAPPAAEKRPSAKQP
jgi:hypothetical protein